MSLCQLPHPATKPPEGSDCNLCEPRGHHLSSPGPCLTPEPPPHPLHPQPPSTGLLPLFLSTPQLCRFPPIWLENKQRPTRLAVRRPSLCCVHVWVPLCMRMCAHAHVCMPLCMCVHRCVCVCVRVCYVHGCVLCFVHACTPGCWCVCTPCMCAHVHTCVCAPV